jgi:hypothetical protein
MEGKYFNNKYSRCEDNSIPMIDRQKSALVDSGTRIKDFLKNPDTDIIAVAKEKTIEILKERVKTDIAIDSSNLFSPYKSKILNDLYV